MRVMSEAVIPEERQFMQGLLLSGGIDSAVLLQHLLDRDVKSVQPIYIKSGLYWQRDELQAVRTYLAQVAAPRIAPLEVLDMPLQDVYSEHWSVSGQGVPNASSPDDAVFLPCRAGLLSIKAIVWCQLHGIRTLALANLKSNPFPDATDRFFQEFESAMNCALPSPISIERPFSHLDKQSVMEVGRNLPLELTFSCIAPINGLHCGRCNKCAERQKAFRRVDRRDGTIYANHPRADSGPSPEVGER